MTPRAYTTLRTWAAREGLREHGAALQLLHVAEVAPGVALLVLPVARRGLHGCYLHAGRPSKRVSWWLDRLAHGGYSVHRIGTASEGVAVLRRYLAPVAQVAAA